LPENKAVNNGDESMHQSSTPTTDYRVNYKVVFSGSKPLQKFNLHAVWAVWLVCSLCLWSLVYGAWFILSRLNSARDWLRRLPYQ